MTGNMSISEEKRKKKKKKGEGRKDTAFHTDRDAHILSAPSRLKRKRKKGEKEEREGGKSGLYVYVCSTVRGRDPRVIRALCPYVTCTSPRKEREKKEKGKKKKEEGGRGAGRRTASSFVLLAACAHAGR